jgi:large subunit ribosomal protein L28
MARRCQISKVQGLVGNRVSHANNRSSHTFQPNLQSKRIFLSDQQKFVRIKVTARMLRTIDKIGLVAALKKHNMCLADIAR